MWERTPGAVYDLPCGLTWVAGEQRLGEYRVSIGVGAAAGSVTRSYRVLEPDAEQPLATRLLARVAGVPTPVATRLLESYGSLAALRRVHAGVLRTEPVSPGGRLSG